MILIKLIQSQTRWLCLIDFASWVFFLSSFSTPGATVSRGGTETRGPGAKVPRGVPAAAWAAAGPVGAGRVRTGTQPPHTAPEPEPGETQRQEEEGNVQKAQAQGQERRDQHASRSVADGVVGTVLGQLFHSTALLHASLFSTRLLLHPYILLVPFL